MDSKISKMQNVITFEPFEIAHWNFGVICIIIKYKTVPKVKSCGLTVTWFKNYHVLNFWDFGAHVQFVWWSLKLGPALTDDGLCPLIMFIKFNFCYNLLNLQIEQLCQQNLLRWFVRRCLQRSISTYNRQSSSKELLKFKYRFSKVSSLWANYKMYFSGTSIQPFLHYINIILTAW